MKIKNIYNKKSDSYDNYRNNESGFNEIKNILDNFLINRNNNKFIRCLLWNRSFIKIYESV